MQTANPQQMQQPQQEIVLKLELPVNFVNTIIFALENVDAPHRATNPVIRSIMEQAQSQTQQTMMGNGEVERKLPEKPSSLN